MKQANLPRTFRFRPVFSWLHPATVTLLVAAVVVAFVVLAHAGDPLALARLGTRFSLGDPQGTEGYDGQFVYYIARSLNPQEVAPYLDVPAYRYQRILLPLLVRLLSLGQETLIPWMLPLVLIAAHTAGTWAVAALLNDFGVSRWYALSYGLFAGFTLAIRLDLSEPLAYGLVAGALLAQFRQRLGLSWVLYGLALFAKEVTVLFLLAQFGADLLNRRWRTAAGLAAFSFVPFILFQGWLFQVFGQMGIGSGGDMATSFELIPYMGLWRIAGYSFVYFLAMLVVFGPSVVLPSIWGIWSALKKMCLGDRSVIVLALLLNATIIAFVPFSTFRETGGLIRFSCGLVLAVILFAGRYQIRRPLNYSLLWPVLNVFLLK